MNSTDETSTEHHGLASAPKSFWRTASPHMIGVFALIWSGVAWAEWFLIPHFHPAAGGPVPHLAFAPQALLLFLGCVAIVLVIPAQAFLQRGRAKSLYALPAAVYVACQICRAV